MREWKILKTKDEVELERNGDRFEIIAVYEDKAVGINREMKEIIYLNHKNQDLFRKVAKIDGDD